MRYKEIHCIPDILSIRGKNCDYPNILKTEFPDFSPDLYGW